MARKCGGILWAICMTLVMAGRVEAVQQVGMLQVIPTWCSKPIAEGTVSVSWVGMKTEDGAVLTDGLANWYVDEEELQFAQWVHRDDLPEPESLASLTATMIERFRLGLE